MQPKELATKKCPTLHLLQFWKWPIPLQKPHGHSAATNCMCECHIPSAVCHTLISLHISDMIVWQLHMPSSPLGSIYTKEHMISHVGGNLQCIHSADLVRESRPSFDAEELWLKSSLLWDFESLGVLVFWCSVPIPGDRFPFCNPPLLLLLLPLLLLPPCCFFPNEKNPSAMSIPDSPLLKELLLPSSDFRASASSKSSNCSSRGEPPTSDVGISSMVLSMVVGESDPVLFKLFLFLAGVKGDSGRN